MMNIEDKVPKKPSGSIPLWPMIITIFTTGFSTKNGLLTVIISIIVYSVFYGAFWLIWLIRIYFYQTKIIAQLHTDYDSTTNQLNTKNEQIDKLDNRNEDLEKDNSDLRSEIEDITTNRDTLIRMYESKQNDYEKLKSEFSNFKNIILTIALSNADLQKAIHIYTDIKEISNDSETISHRENTK
ncbi:hypothetical protein AB0X56_05290 [Weissella paramesenteroides]|uniref:hypothetical protein n=1 Tax=Weissella paramesenteroides TaxID=1249 RepID=UPI003F1FEBA4